jgi:hypothetical protein
MSFQGDFPAGLNYKAVVRVRTPAPLALAHDRRGSTRTVIDSSPKVERMAIQCVLYRTIVRTCPRSCWDIVLSHSQVSEGKLVTRIATICFQPYFLLFFELCFFGSPFLFPPLPLH